MAGKLEANVLLNWNASRFIEHLKRCSLFLWVCEVNCHWLADCWIWCHTSSSISRWRYHQNIHLIALSLLWKDARDRKSFLACRWSPAILSPTAYCCSMCCYPREAMKNLLPHLYTDNLLTSTHGALVMHVQTHATFAICCWPYVKTGLA